MYGTSIMKPLYIRRALLGPRAGPASEGGATSGPEGSQQEAEISLSQDLRFHSDADFVITQTQKGKAKICYDGYRYSYKFIFTVVFKW